MAISRGVFSLNDIIVEQATNSWSRASDVWVAPSPTLATPPNFG